MKTLILPVLCLLLPAWNARAVQTEKFITDSYADFSEGEAHGVTITSDGLLKLGPSLIKVAALPVSTSWAMVRDGKQNVYVAGGNEGQVFKVTPDGNVIEYFKAAELQVSALAFDSKGALYAASMPDGKVYRIDSDGKSSVFFDPQQKYIWALAFDAEDNLFVGTGDKGKLYKVSPLGKSSVFYDSDETHIRTLFFHKPQLWAGSEGNGLVYRFDKTAGEEGVPFVAYDSPYKEIKAFVAAPDGSIFVAAMGDKTGGNITLRPVASVLTLPPPATPAPSLGLQSAKPKVEEVPPAIADQPGAAELVRIQPDGTVERWWTDNEDAYALLLQDQHQIWIGTGHKGRLLNIPEARQVNVLGQLEADAVTAILPAASDEWIASTANPCTLWKLQMKPGRTGTYESRVFDSHGTSRWGAIDFRSSNGFAKLNWETRSGNTYIPDKVWSAWTPLDENRRIQSPIARFIQYRITMETGAKNENTDVIDRVDLYYQPGNQAPRLSHITLTPVNFEIFKTPKPDVTIQPFIPGPSVANSRNNPPKSLIESTEETPTNFSRTPPMQQVRRLGWRSATWQSFDANADDLDYDVYFRPVNSMQWKVLGTHLSDSFISWDSATWPDGEYYLKVVASDLPSNTPETARQDEMISEAFTVDNTAPVIHFKPMEETTQHGVIALTVSDTISIVDQAEYSLDGADWRPLFPITGLYDSRSNAFLIPISDLPPGDHHVVVRASDSADNISSETLLFHK